MPLYEYECDACGHRFEVIQKFSDPPIEACPACSGRVRKLQSAPAFQFKGSGWYITDYARKDQSKAERTTEGKAEGTDEGKDKRKDKGDKGKEGGGEAREAKSQGEGAAAGQTDAKAGKIGKSESATGGTSKK